MESSHNGDLRARLRELADAADGRLPSPRVEAALMRAFAGAHAPRPAVIAPRLPWFRAVAACATLAALVAVLVLQVRNVPRSVPVPAAAAVALPDGFIEVPGAASLPRLESARIVRYELPLAALPAYGLEIAPGAERRAVEADLLIGQDGYTRAIRLR